MRSWRHRRSEVQLVVYKLLDGDDYGSLLGRRARPAARSRRVGAQVPAPVPWGRSAQRRQR